MKEFNQGNIVKELLQTILEGFDEHLKGEVEDDEFAVIELEDYNGNSLMAVYLETKTKQVVQSKLFVEAGKTNYPINYETFGLADVDGDYIFDTEALLIRLQSNLEEDLFA